MRLINAIERWNRTLSIWISFALIALIGTLDFFTGYELSLSPFYLLTIAVLAWKGDRWIGFAGAALSTVIWALANGFAGQAYSTHYIVYWNGLARFLTYAIMAILISSLRELIAHLETMSRMDPLTGAANARTFKDLLKAEIARSRRYQRPFTLTYLDLDNFKKINDSLGHSTGDTLLRTVVSTIRSNMRESDVVARLGGDEFALLLPESDLGGARTVVTKIRSGFLREMRSRGWPVTMSVGSLTCTDAGSDFSLGADELIKKADALMYQSKYAGKDMASFSSVPVGARD